jgi:hypothetical protein
MQNQSKTQEESLKELREEFSAYREGKEGRIIYRPEHRKKAIAGIQEGMTLEATALACGVTTATIRSWVHSEKAVSVKRLELEKQEFHSEFAIIHVNERVRIEIPVLQLTAELLRELFALR